MNSPRRAVGDDVDRLKLLAAFQGLGDLARRRPAGVQHDRFDLGPEISQDRLEIGG
jgi:hypothetical protein